MIRDIFRVEFVKTNTQNIKTLYIKEGQLNEG